MRSLRAILLMVVAITGYSLQAEEAQTPVSERVAVYRSALHPALDVTEAERRDTAARLYEELFSEFRQKALEKVSDADLQSLYKAAGTADFYTFESRFRDDMRYYFDALERRGLASEANKVRMFDAYIGGRDFAGARRFHEQLRLGQSVVMPAYSEAEGLDEGLPTVLEVDATRNAVLRRSQDIGNGPQVVVVSHPLCHFSRDAAAAIEADPELAEAFEDHALWLVPQVGRLDIKEMQEWNRASQGRPKVIAFHRSEWPDIDYWGTPTFYFFENGRLVTRVMGWPAEGRREEVRAALAQIGLLQ